MSGTWDRLIEMVEEGEALTLPWMAVLNVAQSIYADSAYRGSLDNAKALHDELLPGWWWAIEPETVGGTVSVGHPDVRRGPFFGQAMAGTAHAPARSWLLAILRAKAGAP